MIRRRAIRHNDYAVRRTNGTCGEDAGVGGGDILAAEEAAIASGAARDAAAGEFFLSRHAEFFERGTRGDDDDLGLVGFTFAIGDAEEEGGKRDVRLIQEGFQRGLAADGGEAEGVGRGG